MKTVVIYYSKTGNTQGIAEAIALEIRAEAFPLNLMKKGRRTNEEKARERALFSHAIDTANEADLVIIGTPTEFRKPHPQVMTFLERIATRNTAIFCTYYGMVGATLIDMEARLRQRNIRIVGILAVCVGTERYRFRRDVRHYAERITETHIVEAKAFARHCCFEDVEPVELRLWGMCGKACRTCSRYQQQECEGAGTRCWSGSDCQIFACCVLKKSLTGCVTCQVGQSCRARETVLTRNVRVRNIVDTLDHVHG